MLDQRETMLRSMADGLAKRETKLQERESRRGKREVKNPLCPYAIGDKVRTAREITFTSGRTCPRGEIGTVTKIPGDRPGTICEVRVIKTGALFDAKERDVEDLYNSKSQKTTPSENDSGLHDEVRSLKLENSILQKLLNQSGGDTSPSGIPQSLKLRCCNEPHSPYCKVTGESHFDRQREFEEYQSQKNANSVQVERQQRDAAELKAKQLETQMKLQQRQRKSIIGSTRAVLIGINYYGTPEQLRHSVDCVENMAGYLERSGFDSDICLLSDDTPERLPTRSNIMKALKWMVQSPPPESAFFFHFVGHSILPEDSIGEDIPFQGMAPLDYHENGYIFTDEIISILQDLPRGCKATVIMDTVPGGAIVPLPYRIDPRTVSLSRGAAEISADVQCLIAVPPNKSTDPSQHFGVSNGHLSSAFITAMGWRHRPTQSQLLTDIHGLLLQRQISEYPFIFASQASSPEDVFKLGILSTMEQNRRVRHWAARLEKEERILNGVELQNRITSAVVQPPAPLLRTRKRGT